MYLQLQLYVAIHIYTISTIKMTLCSLEYISFSVIYYAVSECPPDAEHRIQICIKSSLPNFGLGPPVDASPPSALKTSIEMSRDSCQ